MAGLPTHDAPCFLCGAAESEGVWSTPDRAFAVPGTYTVARSRAVEQAGGRVSWCWHQAKPRYYLWSLGFWLRDRGWHRLARAAEWRPVYGVLKLALELALPIARWVRRGEVIRVGVAPRADSPRP